MTDHSFSFTSKREIISMRQILFENERVFKEFKLCPEGAKKDPVEQRGGGGGKISRDPEEERVHCLTNAKEQLVFATQCSQQPTDHSKINCR